MPGKRKLAGRKDQKAGNEVMGQGEEALDFQMFTPHPGPLPVWRGEGVRHTVPVASWCFN